MRYVKEVRFRLSGDKTAARRLTARARTQLGELLARSGTLAHVASNVKLPDGVRFSFIATKGLIPIVEIFVPFDEVVINELLVGLLIDFVTVTDPFVGVDTRQTPHVFNAELTSFRDPEPPLGVPVRTNLIPTTQLSGGSTLYGPQYAYESEPYITQREDETIGPILPGVPYERRTYTVPLPGGEAVYVSQLYSSAFGWGTFHSQGELPRKVVANTRNVFILLERVFPSTTSIGVDSQPFAMTSTLLLDIYEFDGTRTARIQLAPSIELTLGGGAFVYRDNIAAYDSGFYAVLKPLPSLPGYDVIKWSVEDGFQWSAAALPPDVTEPLAIYAGPIGPYLGDSTNGYPRLSLLNPDNGESVDQLTVFEASFPPVINGSVTPSVAVTASFIYVYLGIEETGGPLIGATTHRILRYTPDLNLEESIDAKELAELVDVDLSLGYAIPYVDSALLEAP